MKQDLSISSTWLINFPDCTSAIAAAALGAENLQDRFRRTHLKCSTRERQHITNFCVSIVWKLQASNTNCEFGENCPARCDSKYGKSSSQTRRPWKVIRLIPITSCTTAKGNITMPESPSSSNKRRNIRGLSFKARHRKSTSELGPGFITLGYGGSQS